MPSASVLVTVRNEEANVGRLLESLVGQAELKEVIVVDAASSDGTVGIVESYSGRLPLTLLSRTCRRGEGRNLAAKRATGDLLAFIDGDCVASPAWLGALVNAWDGRPGRIVAGDTRLVGRKAFAGMHRVELPHHGQDTTWPSCNLAYPRALFESLGGFDPSFVTAEDIDLNFRAVSAGATIVHAPDAVVEASARGRVGDFLRQGYWNGYGRKQLTRKHGRLWRQYSLGDMLRRQAGSFWGAVRMGVGTLGYLAAKFGRRPP